VLGVDDGSELLDLHGELLHGFPQGSILQPVLSNAPEEDVLLLIVLGKERLESFIHAPTDVRLQLLLRSLKPAASALEIGAFLIFL